MEKVKNKKRLKPFIKHILFSFFILVFSLLGYFLLTKGLNNKETISIKYDENNNIDYKVYLKPNSFFESSYLPKDSTYISTLIDYIDTDFNFNMHYNKKVVGTYTYFIRGSLVANKTDSAQKSYLTKEYVLTDNVTGTINNQKNFSIKQNIKIDYQKYNELLTEFKREYGLTIDGKLKVELIVKSTVNSSDSSKPLENTSSMNVEIPLTEQSVDISINTNPEVKSSSVTLDTLSINDTTHKLYLWGGISSIIIVFMLIIYFIKEIHYEQSRISKYNKELSKILDTYDSIIVTVNKVKDLSSYNIIKVNTFEELLDAHNEVRMPINFIEVERNEESVFVLINENVAWLYVLKNDSGEANEKN
jgi:hypothetical protein